MITNETGGTGITPITDTEAKTLLTKYISTAVKPTSPVKGVFLDRQQLDAMNKLVQENPAVPGFRVFFGMEVSGAKVGIVVGVNDANQDQVTRSIFKTLSPKTGPCPPVCDQASPINQD